MAITDINREKQRIALSSVAAAVFLTAIKLVVGLETNSLGILSEAAHSGLDLLAAILTFAAVRIADRPPDKDHPYGHGKVENVSALLQTVLLFLTCAWIVWEAIHRLLSHEVHIEANLWSFLVMAVAIGIDMSRSRALSRTARKHNSQALEADALHFSSDVWSSLVVLAGLVFVSFGFPTVDAVAAIGVALLVLFVSYRLGRRTIDALMDKVPEGLEGKIHDAIRSVGGVEDIRSIRVRQSGAKVFVDTTIGIRRTTPFHHAHAIMDEVETAVQVIRADIDVVVHAEPIESGDETIADKVRMIVVREGQRAPHNLEVHQSDGKHYIEFDLEYLKGNSFTAAHDVASLIEKKIRDEIPLVGKTTIHMEEYEPEENQFEDVTGRESVLRQGVEQCVLMNSNIVACHDITILKEEDSFNVSLSCRIESSKSLGEVHSLISETEAALYRNFPALRRVTIHAEPV